MKESPKPKGQSPKSSRRFVVEMIARLVGRVNAVVRVLSGAWEHSTANFQQPTSNEDAAARIGTAEHRNLVRPLLSKGGEGNGEETNIDKHVGHDFEGSSAYTKSLSNWAGTGVGKHRTSNIQQRTSNEDGAARPGTANVPLASSVTGERDARDPRQTAPGDFLPPSGFGDHGSAARPSVFNPDLITRQELQRELASLRKLIESRK